MMEYEKLILSMAERITDLEERVSALEKGNMSLQVAEASKGSKKYRYLSEYLSNSNQKSVTLSFSEIEKILQFELPDSARNHRPFWANTTTHSIALSWLSVGYETVSVNMDKQVVVFEKTE